MPDHITSERFVLMGKLDAFREGGLESRIKIVALAVESCPELFGPDATLISTHEDHIHVLAKDGRILRAECSWSGDVLSILETSEADTIFADRREVSLFVANRMNAASKMLIEGNANDANKVLHECSEFLDKGAGSWLIEDIEQDIKEWIEVGRSWRTVVKSKGANRILDESISAGKFNDMSIDTTAPRKELIQDALALMIAKTERVIELAGETLVNLGESAKPETIQVLRALAQDAVFLGERMEESLECVRYTSEASLRRFYETVSNELNEMALALISTSQEPNK